MNYSEEDTRSKYVDPALRDAGWSEDNIRREVAKARKIDKGARVDVEECERFLKSIEINS